MRVEVINEYVDRQTKERTLRGASFDVDEEKGKRLISQGLAKEIHVEPKQQPRRKKTRKAQE